MTLRNILKDILDEKELSLVPTSFDIIGNREKAVAIIDIPEKLLSKKKMIAEALMKKHKNVKSVLLKATPRSGVYRTRNMELIAGDSNTEVVHKESGINFSVDPREVYFSPRESTERMRIAEKIRPGETVMVFFAGVGPFAIIAAKKAKPTEVIAIEINPVGVQYMLKNIKSSRLSNVHALFGDVLEQSREYYGKCDRVIMPLPEWSFDYLEEALKCLKSRGTIHMYFFSSESELEQWKKKVKNTVNKKRPKIGVSRVLPYGPRIWKYRMDIKL